MARGRYKPPPALEDLSALVRHAESDRASWLAVLNIAGFGPKPFTGDVIEQFRNQTPGEIQAVHADLRAFLRTAAGCSSGALQLPFQPTLQLLNTHSGVRVVVSGKTPRDVTLYLAAALIEAAGAERLRCCPAPNCGRAFVKIGRREYCSAECQRRVFLSKNDPSAARPTISRSKKKGARDARKAKTRKR